MLTFQPEPLVDGSNIILEKKELSSLSHDKKKNEKNLNYITSDGKKYSEELVSDLRFIHSHYIKNEKVIDMLYDFNVDIDRLNKKLFIYSKYNLPFSPRVVFMDNIIYLVADIKYTADDWLFANNISISVDGKLTNIDNLKFDREVRSGAISETSVFILDDLKIELLKDIVKSKNSFVRFNGSKYYQDKEITKEYKKQILEILKIYYLSKKIN